jgi:two-component system sensor histidine kinase VicK
MQFLLRNPTLYKFVSLGSAIVILCLGLSITHIALENLSITFSILISAIALILQLYLPQYHLINIAGITTIIITTFFRSQIPIGLLIGFISVGIAFLFKTHAYRSIFRTFIIFSLSALIFFIGTVGIALYIFPITILSQDQVASITHFYPSICLMLIAISLMSGNIYLDIRDMAFFWDIASVHKAQLLKFSEKIIVTLSSSISINEGMTKVLEIFHESYGWEVLTLWQLNKVNNELECTHIGYIPFVKKPTIKKSVSLQNWAYPAPIWCKDISKEPHLDLENIAINQDLKGFLAFPLYQNHHVEGVVKLFKRAPFKEGIDDSVLDIVPGIAISINDFIQKCAIDVLNAQLVQIVTHSIDAIYSCDFNGIITSWNKGAENIYGWSQIEIIGQNIKVLYPKTQSSQIESILQEVEKRGSIEHFEIQNVKKSAEPIWVNNTYSIMRDSGGNKIGISSISQDITEHKSMLQKLRESEAKFRIVVETTSEWIWEMDLSYTFTYSNPAIETILGYKNTEITGKNILFFISKEENKDFAKKIEANFHSKKEWREWIIFWRHKDGSVRALESNGMPILNENGDLVGFRGVDRDITERQKLEKLQNEFISMVGHELRTPLSSIYGALGLLNKEENIPSKMKELLSIAYRNSERLSLIINDILDVERFQDVNFKLEKKPVILKKIIQEAVQSLSPLAQNACITIIQEPSLIDEVVVDTHSDRIMQVIVNLLSNAIKFSPRGSKIFISMEKIGSKLRTLIRDEGKGISEAFKPKVFEKFSQEVVPDNRSKSGTGLGLNISKTIIQHLGGSIGFESLEGKGSTFYFDLPISGETL